MTSVTLIVIVLALLLCAGATALWLDARQRRMDRQLEIAIPVSELADLPSIRRLQIRRRGQFFYRLVNYKPEIDYALHPSYVLLIGLAAAALIFYANNLFAFST